MAGRTFFHTAWRGRAPLDQPLFISWIAVGLFFVIALLPVVMMLGQSFFIEGTLSLRAYSLFTDTRVLGLLMKSLGMAAAATLLSLCVGVPFAVLIGRADFMGRKFCHMLYLVPLFIPPHIQALAWIYLLGDTGGITKISSGMTPVFNLYSPAGTAIILALSYCPILILLTLTGLMEIDQRLEESACLQHSALATLSKITLPLIRPYIVSGAVFVFIFSFFNYGVPSMLRVPSFPVEIFTRFSAFYDEAGAVALSAPLITIALMLLIFQAVHMKKRLYATIPSANQKLPCPPLFGRVRWSASYAYLLLTVAVVLPLIALALQAGELKSYQLAWQTSSREIGSSIVLAAAAATAVTLLAYCLSVFLNARSTYWRQLLNFFTFLPFAFPAALFGIGLIHLWNRPQTQLIYTTSSILLIAYTARFIPFAIRIITARLRQIQPSLREAAFLCQSHWLKRLWCIELPLVRQGLIVCWVVIFIFSMGELGATLLLIPPGSGTVSLKVYTLMHYGAGPLVAALALILIGSNLLVASTLLVRTAAK